MMRLVPLCSCGTEFVPARYRIFFHIRKALGAILDLVFCIVACLRSRGVFGLPAFGSLLFWAISCDKRYLVS
jgi:hypothetical protein